MTVSCKAKCKKPCHHKEPHEPEIVGNQGSRIGRIIPSDNQLCTVRGRCDAGLFVKCTPVKETTINEDDVPKKKKYDDIDVPGLRIRFLDYGTLGKGGPYRGRGRDCW